MNSIRPFALERYFDQHEFTTRHMLSASDCETVTIGELLELAGAGIETLTELRLGYTETQGNPELRQAIAGLYNNVLPDDIVVTNAPAEALFLAMHTMAPVDSRVVVLTPCYQSLKDIVAFRGCQVEPWPLLETNTGWQLNMDALADLLAPPTSLLVINFPHNPTGTHPDRDTFERILRLAEERRVRVFSDEMYRGLEPSEKQRLPTAPDVSAGTVSLWGLSKTFGLPGLRMGWLVVRDAQLRQQILNLKDYTTLCSSGPGERLARIALTVADELAQRNRDIIARNTRLVSHLVTRHSRHLDWRAPAAGPVALARLKSGPADTFCDRVRREQGVLLVPSPLFDWGNAHLRIGLGREQVPAALEALEPALR